MTTSLAQRVVAGLKDKIFAGDLPPGLRLPSETELVDEFGVSRTVVREAVTRLRAEGLVETFQGRGSFVLAVPEPTSFTVESAAIRSHHDVLDMIDFRLGIECEAAALAAARMDAAGAHSVRTALTEFTEAAPEDAVEADFRVPPRRRGGQWQPLLPRSARLTRPDDDHAAAHSPRCHPFDHRCRARRADPSRA